jgi:hypothetical protein
MITRKCKRELREARRQLEEVHTLLEEDLRNISLQKDASHLKMVVRKEKHIIRILQTTSIRSVNYSGSSYILHVRSKGKIDNQPIAILIDYGASHSYINSNIVERFHLQRSKHKKSWLVQLATRAKRMIIELVKDCPIDMNGLNTKVDVNIIPLGSYDCLTSMDWLEKHHAILDYYNKTITCLDEDGKQGKIQGIPRVVVVSEISAMQLKKSFRKGCQFFAAHMEEAARDKVASIEDHPVLTNFEDVFGEILGLPPKRDIDFSINLVPGVAQCPRHLIEWAHQN